MWAVVALTFGVERSVSVRARVSHSFRFLSSGWRTIFTFVNLLGKTRYGFKCLGLLLLHRILGWDCVRVRFKVKTRQTRKMIGFCRGLALGLLSSFKLFSGLAHRKHQCFQLLLEGKVRLLRDLARPSLRRSQWDAYHAALLERLLRRGPLGFLQRPISFCSVIFSCLVSRTFPFVQIPAG